MLTSHYLRSGWVVRQVTDRHTKAIEQLGSDGLEVGIGGPSIHTEAKSVYFSYDHSRSGNRKYRFVDPTDTPLAKGTSPSRKNQYSIWPLRGSHVAVLTNNRPPADVDFLVHDDDIDELKKVFPAARSNESESAISLYVDDDNLIEFMGRANIHKGGAVYPFRLTDLAFRHLDTYNTRLGTIKIVNPVDTLLLKAVLQRGESQGKHDLEDIMSVLAQIEIDREYLKARMKETKTRELTADVWNGFGIQVGS